jgi:rfaE bifunctional protein nucleotidyltransferase chain/domain
VGEVVSQQAIRDVLAQHRCAGQKVVSINGCFDLVHASHVRILRHAASQGDILVVGLNSDASIRALKGPGRPVLPEEERSELLAALEMVDYVVVFDEPDCCNFVRLVQPDVHVNDASYGPDCIEAGIVRAGGGRLHLVEKFPGLSTSEIIRKIRGVD